MRPLNSRETDGVLIITLDDPLSVNDGQSDLYRQSIYGFIAEHPRPRVAVDLAPIEFLSSSGVALLIGLRRRVVASDGSLALFHVHSYVQDLLCMMKLSSLFQIVPDEVAALALLPPLPTD